MYIYIYMYMYMYMYMYICKYIGLLRKQNTQIKKQKTKNKK